MGPRWSRLRPAGYVRHHNLVDLDNQEPSSPKESELHVLIEGSPSRRYPSYYLQKWPSGLNLAIPLSGDSFLHVLSFLSPNELALSCACVSKSWNAAVLSPSLPHWQSLDLSRKWNKVSDSVVNFISEELVQYSRLQILTLDDCVELTEKILLVISTAVFRNSVQEISFCGCLNIRLDKAAGRLALEEMVSRCPMLRKLELYGTGMKNSSAFQAINVVRNVSGDIDLGKFQILRDLMILKENNLPVVDKPCQFDGAPGAGPCWGNIYPHGLFSNCAGRSQINVIQSILFCCLAHRDSILSLWKCTRCHLFFVPTDPSLLRSAFLLESPICRVCHDRNLFSRKQTWIELQSEHISNPEFNVLSRLVPIGSKKHLPPSLMLYGASFDLQELKFFLEKAKLDHMSRALCCIPFRTDEEKLNVPDPPIEIYADTGLITDPRIGGHKRLRLSQETWRHGWHVISSVIISVLLVAFFKFIFLDLANRPSFRPDTVNFGASLKQSQQETTSLGFLILVGASLIVTGLVIFICWWRFRMQWERIFGLILGLDFMVIMAMGNSVLAFIFLQWSSLRIDIFTLSLLIWNFAFVGSSMLYIRGNFLDLIPNLEKLQRKYLVLINSVMAAMVSLTLSKQLVVGFLTLPILLEVVEIWRNFVLIRQGFQPASQYGFLWLADSSERSTTVPVIMYEIPESNLRLRTADIMWLGLIASIPDYSIFGGVFLILGLVMIFTFLVPYIKINYPYPQLTISFLFMACYSLLERHMVKFANRLII